MIYLIWGMCKMTEAKQHKKGSIFWKLIASYLIFSFFAIVIVVGVLMATTLLAIEVPDNFEFPGIAIGENGEELDEDYQVKKIYGEKKTDMTQYTPETLLAWTDQRTGNTDFRLYWQKKEGGFYLIFYPVRAYSIVFLRISEEGCCFCCCSCFLRTYFLSAFIFQERYTDRLKT